MVQILTMKKQNMATVFLICKIGNVWHVIKMYLACWGYNQHRVIVCSPRCTVLFTTPLYNFTHQGLLYNIQRPTPFETFTVTLHWRMLRNAKFGPQGRLLSLCNTEPPFWILIPWVTSLPSDFTPVTLVFPTNSYSTSTSEGAKGKSQGKSARKLILGSQLLKKEAILIPPEDARNH